MLTPAIIARYIFLSNIGRHGNNGDLRVYGPDINRRRDSIAIGHDDVHEDEVEPFGIVVDLVGCLLAVSLQTLSDAFYFFCHQTWSGETAYCNLDRALNLGQELGAYPGTGFVVLDEEDSWFLGAPQRRVHFFAWRRCYLCWWL